MADTCSPRIKHFIWLCLRGHLSTSAFLHSIHIGPDTLCVLCGLHRETIDHLFCQCDRIQGVWNWFNSMLNTSISFTNGFSSGNWITEYGQSLCTLAFIAVGAWYIWICRCNAIFKNVCPNYSSIVTRTTVYVDEFSLSTKNPFGRKLILNNFSTADGYFLFTHAATNYNLQVRSICFFFSNANYEISLAGCVSQCLLDYSLDEIFALEVALQTALALHIPVKHILYEHHAILDLIQCSDHTSSWRFQQQISNLNFLMDMCNRLHIHIIPASWGIPAANLASIGFHHQHLNLFLFGKDLPFWIMQSFLNNGFSF